jgi:hypothetical protein
LPTGVKTRGYVVAGGVVREGSHKAHAQEKVLVAHLPFPQQEIVLADGFFGEMNRNFRGLRQAHEPGAVQKLNELLVVVHAGGGRWFGR